MSLLEGFGFAACSECNNKSSVITAISTDDLASQQQLHIPYGDITLCLAGTGIQ